MGYVFNLAYICALMKTMKSAVAMVIAWCTLSGDAHSYYVSTNRYGFILSKHTVGTVNYLISDCPCIFIASYKKKTYILTNIYIYNYLESYGLLLCIV